jgi:hypothetical protein
MPPPSKLVKPAARVISASRRASGVPWRAFHAVVDRRKAVQQGGAGVHGLLDADGGLLVAVLAGVGVDGGRQKVGSAFGLEVAQQLDVLVDQGHAGARLQEQASLPAGRMHGRCETFFFGDGLLAGQGALPVHAGPGRPAGQDFRALGFVFGPGQAMAGLRVGPGEHEFISLRAD